MVKTFKLHANTWHTVEPTYITMWINSKHQATLAEIACATYFPCLHWSIHIGRKSMSISVNVLHR